jgi:putative cell wall-binding protein
VYLVTGEKFPDALAAGAAAGLAGGPVLLTRTASLPAPTANELKRLAPQRVVVVGGPAAVSDTVIEAVRTLLSGTPVDRVWGEDRFATAAQLSQATYTATGGTVYVGSGLGFTEILAASAVAGRDKVPLLLVPGTGTGAGLPLSMAVELQRLNPRRVVVLGGVTLVSDAVVGSIRNVVPSATIDRVAGANGYETAAGVASTFAGGGTIYVATGDVFADGLAGGAAAVNGRSAMVMVPPSGQLPAAVRAVLAQLRPSRVVVLGGTAAIAPEVENAIAAYLP